jgi:D-cysteine desulfhydrase
LLALLHQRFPELESRLPRLEICDLPTPVRHVAGLDLWVKDDGVTAAPWGGNKPRKLEWTLADALARGYGTVLTFGGLATNHGLATALYARRHGLRSALALVDQPRDAHVEQQLARTLEAADAVHLTGSKARTALALPYLLARHAQLRPPRPPYWLPVGGSSPVGVLGFVEAALELAAQVQAGELPEPATLVIALGSGGSTAGLVAGLRLAGLHTRVHAVLVNDRMDLRPGPLLRLGRRSLDLLPGTEDIHLDPSALTVDSAFLGPGYGHAIAEGAEATRIAAEHAELTLEPVYTAKAFAALLARRRAGALGPGPVLYWHTHTRPLSRGGQTPA